MLDDAGCGVVAMKSERLTLQYGLEDIALAAS